VNNGLTTEKGQTVNCSFVKKPNTKDNPERSTTLQPAFTLIELLVVISVIALLLSILIPSLTAAKARARQIVCQNNIHQLVIANTGYAVENNGFYVPAASDMWEDFGGFNRWHGTRTEKDKPFDPTKGPLATYLANGRVKECPEKTRFLKTSSWAENYEQGSGGYGYNMTYIGSRLWRGGFTTLDQWKQAYSQTTRICEVTRPDQTLMFADCAMSTDQKNYIETSFAWQPFILLNGIPATDYHSPTIHFRHRRCANIGWTDGHVTAKKMAPCDLVNAFMVESGKMLLGWFEPVDNSSFDLK